MTDHVEVRLLEPAGDPLIKAMTLGSQALWQQQSNAGYWHYELEADATIPAEYLLLHYFLDDIDAQRAGRITRYLQRIQLSSGAWPLFANGPGNLSATVKAYFALKVAGHDVDAPDMQRARRWVLANGGAERVNVFTRITLAIFGQLPWRTVPAMPIEIVFLPQWWFFNLNRVSYWSRCVLVPLLILFAKRPTKQMPPEKSIRELFLQNSGELKHLDAFQSGGMTYKNLFIALDRVLKVVEKMIPGFVRRAAIRRGERWLRAHMQGTGGIGAIFPAMANAVMALNVLGAERDDPEFARNLQAIEDLVLDGEQEAYVQPCLSPIWDTCLALAAVTESGAQPDSPPVRLGVQWLFDQQIMERGDWCNNAPDLSAGGWCFQFENALYPDVDDTGMVLMALLRAGGDRTPEQQERIRRGVEWVLGMQNLDGSWAAFDIGNNSVYLNDIPFADHGALVDPGTADLTGRVIELLAMLGYDSTFPPLARGLEFLRRDQLDCGAWYGRWGVNYLYGTWSVLSAVGMLDGDEISKAYVRKAVEWLKAVQNDDGGWGESCSSYDDPMLKGKGESTASQTAWAVLGLMAVGEVESPAVRRGIDYLLAGQSERGDWEETLYTGTGFPRVFYLRYHGYAKYFPLWALSNFAHLRRGLPTRQLEVQAHYQRLRAVPGSAADARAAPNHTTPGYIAD